MEKLMESAENCNKIYDQLVECTHRRCAYVHIACHILGYRNMKIESNIEHVL